MPRALGAAVIFILAAFTRPIALPVPVLLLASLLLPRPSRAQLIAVGIATGLVVAAVAAWSVRTYLSTGEWVIISNGLAGHFWLGSRGDGQWHGNAHFQAELEAMKDRYGGREAYVEDALKTIAADPPAYVRLLLVKLGQAYLQPHGTVAFPGESLKDLTVRMMQGQVSVGALLSSQAFWPKLYMYVFHLASLAGGLLGLWLSRRDWLKVLPLSLPIAYFTVAYTLLTNIPRYMFPIMPFYMILAAYAAIALAGPRAAPAAAAEV